MKVSQLQNIAALDLGSNSLHLIVAQIDPEAGFRTLDTEKITLSLAQYLDDELMIDTNVFSEVIDAFRRMKAIAQRYQASIHCVATYTARTAKNFNQLQQQIKHVTGIDVKVISGIEEARLELLGIREGLNFKSKEFTMVDIGGGSTEIVQTSHEPEVMNFINSLDIGAVTLSEKFGFRQKFKVDQFRNFQKYLQRHLKSSCTQIQSTALGVASSGTAKTIMRYFATRRLGDVSDLHGLSFTQKDLDSFCQQLVKLADPKRIEIEMDIDKKRASIILAGAHILLACGQFFNIKKWYFSDYALREGLIVDYIERSSKISKSDPHATLMLPPAGVLNFSRHYYIDAAAAVKASKFVTSLFNALYEDKNENNFLTREDLLYLQSAAYLREIGRFVHFKRSHKHSAYLIRNGEIHGLSSIEKLWVAVIVRFHEKKPATFSRLELFDPSSLLAQTYEGDVLDRVLFLSGVLRLNTLICRLSEDYPIECTGIERVGERYHFCLSGVSNKHTQSLLRNAISLQSEEFTEAFQVEVGLKFRG